MMRFYTNTHRFYCGIDLHTRTLSLCILDDRGAIVCQRTMPPEPGHQRVRDSSTFTTGPRFHPAGPPRFLHAS